jgi:integrase
LDLHGALDDGEPGDRVCPEVVVAYIAFLQSLQNASATVLARLQELHDAIKVICPNQDWRWIQQIASRIRLKSVSVRSKREKMVATDDLLTLGLDLMRGARARAASLGAAIDYRDGLIVALLSLRPLRLGNLTALELSRTLVRNSGGHRIVFEGNETKNGSPLEMFWPIVLNSALETWLDTYRPILRAQTQRWERPVGGALWVSSHGSPMTRTAIYDRIRLRTKEAFGHAINPHLFRDVAATTLAIADPGHVRVAAEVLGHRSFQATEKYYVQARMLETTTRYQEAVIALRSRSTR